MKILTFILMRLMMRAAYYPEKLWCTQERERTRSTWRQRTTLGSKTPSPRYLIAAPTNMATHIFIHELHQENEQRGRVDTTTATTTRKRFHMVSANVNKIAISIEREFSLNRSTATPALGAKIQRC
mmetsp:Transcript_22211/g.56012  ORF Transcript_22211/g.56012 Transcript_22211/m.56012 type:complete len:126 (+) Transcript_22211:442-819(+)